MTRPTQLRQLYHQHCRKIACGFSLLLFVVLVLLPSGQLVRGFFVDGVFSLRHYEGVFSDPRIYELFLRSLAMAGGATLLSLVIGVPLALGLEKQRLSGRTLSSILIVLPLLIPPHIHTLAWIALCGKKGFLQLFLQRLLDVTLPSSLLYSMFGAIMLLFFSYFPLVVLLTMAGLRGMDSALEEIGNMHQPPLRVLRSITLPLIVPHCCAGAVFVFILSFFNYGVPAMLRVPSYPGEIFTRFSAMYDPGGTAALVAPVVLLCCILLFGQWRIMQGKQYTALSSHARSRKPARQKSRTGVVALFVYGCIFVTAFLPLASLVAKSGSPASFKAAWVSSAGAIGSTCSVAGIASVLTTLLAVILVHCIQRFSGRIRNTLDMLTFLPLAMPAFFVGIGLIYIWNRPFTQVVYSTGAILVLACIVRFVPFAVRIIYSAHRQVSPGVFEASSFCKRHALARWLQLDFPLLLRGIVVSLCILFIFSSGELGATLLVIPPGMSTLSLKIYTIMHYGAGPLVAASALILIGINLFFSAGSALCDHLMTS